MKNVVHIWELERVYIKLNLDFLDEINRMIKKKFGSKSKFYEQIIKNNELSFSTFKNILKKSNMKNFFVPLSIYLKIVINLGVTREILERNIVAYKTGRGSNYVDNPILPIKITPIFDMVLAHNIGDGTVINSKNGRLPYFGYRQFNEYYRKLYIKKIESLFGKIKFKEDYFHRSTRSYCPSVLSSLFFNYYNLGVNSFLSKSARLPEELFRKNREHLLAILIAFVIDEGHIDSSMIVIVLKNKLLINDLKNICDLLGYNSKITYRSGEYEDYGYLNILRDGMIKFYHDSLLLRKKYFVVDLGVKGKKIEDSIKIYSRKLYKTKGNRDIILSILKNEQLSVNQLANRVNMTRQGARFHIHKLLKENMIKIVDKNDPNWIYGV
ncbi:hypothetical protein CMI38_06935 [Candidatus Pacearchaeota archaeon]|jgi:hypothetical protein|nr:hypothetical protein [Candidatus Pacearchaeota archaeon]|tara:strand:- start:6854 stop:7999 length:1146 start_codon:yes stop_codon:yes gene_type:complete